MKDLIKNIIESSDWILKTNLILTGVFFCVILGFIFVILYLRISKILRNQKIEKYRNIFSDFITRYLFDEKEVSLEAVQAFKQAHIKHTLGKRTAIQVLLIFEQNFNGEANQKVKELFVQWDLKNYIQRDLKSEKWYKIARAIYIASELNLKSLAPLIEKHIDSEKDELRQQAMLYYIQLSDNSPLEFLGRIKKPLTRWEQIYIEECLKSNYTGITPDFSRWLESELNSIQSFSINMIGEYNQFENIPQLVPFLSSESPELKKETIHSLGKLGYPDLVPHLLKMFKNEPPAVKSFILKTVSNIGAIDDLITFEKMIPKDDWVSRQVYFNLTNFREKDLSLSSL
ncbi:HEAT repeat domain-containing protein [Christiangramia sp.]|uniref:HEAT repeat domain-containing protein n=1 Tax=Christiangramia sp. TaxID=1931228 RepID=UPI002607D870|nr:HEAT repeat domain-containing protein [Christiangramia sp.]